MSQNLSSAAVVIGALRVNGSCVMKHDLLHVNMQGADKPAHQGCLISTSSINLS